MLLDPDAALAVLGPTSSSDSGDDGLDPDPPLPGADLRHMRPPDLVLRQLPVPGAVLGGAALVTALRPLYSRLAGSQE